MTLYRPLRDDEHDPIPDQARWLEGDWNNDAVLLVPVANIKGVASFLISGEFDSFTDMVAAFTDDRIVTVLNVTTKDTT